MSTPRAGRRAHALGQGLVLAVLAAAVLALGQWQPQPLWAGAPRPGRAWAAGLAVVAYAIWLLWVLRRRTGAASEDAPSPDAVLVAHASQTGFALQLAERTADSLRAAGVQAHLRALDEATPAQLADYRRVLFVASTSGEGDAPDPALGFLPALDAGATDLRHLQFAVLALGDSRYARFCGFGRQLDQALRRHGATPLFDRVEVDNADQAALRHWQHHLGVLGGDTELPDWSPPAYQPWVLLERRRLNPGSPGAGAFLLSLQPVHGAHWQAGDIAEIGPRHAPAAVRAWLQAAGLDAAAPVTAAERGMVPLAQALSQLHLPAPDEARAADPQALVERLPRLPHREYSIASLPEDGVLQLLVRRMQHADGTPGLGSGWLVEHAQLGQPVDLRLRANPQFHAPGPSVPLLLVGNGTGMAGLRALLRQRALQGAHRNWLLFGERTRTHDFFFQDELLAWQREGHLARLDLAFSRDPPRRRYVQHLLEDAAAEVRHWVDEGAAIYVCGSLAGMAPAVDAVLRQILGEARVEQLRGAGRYRRDVY